MDNQHIFVVLPLPIVLMKMKNLKLSKTTNQKPKPNSYKPVLTKIIMDKMMD